MTKKSEIRLRDEGTGIEGTLAEVNELSWLGPRHCLQTVRWRCPCGAEIDTATIAGDRFFSVGDGYFVQCPGCGRWYRHHVSQGYVEGSRTEGPIADALLKRMPDETGFLRAVLAEPEDAGVWAVYADYLEERGDSRAEALRLKCSIGGMVEGEPRRREMLARLEQLRPALDAEWFALVIRFGPAGLCLIGSQDTDLADLPQRFLASGVNVRPFGVVRNGDYVIFCISCTDGPMPNTRDAVLRCAGHAIAPVAIVLTKVELSANDSLRNLVTMEEMELLSQVIPRDEVERLLIYYDFDPGLVRKLLSLINEGPAIITC